MTTLETLLALAKTDEGRMRVRVMVAELVGWKYHGSVNGDLYMWPPLGGDAEAPPNYTGSLDAMAEVEELHLLTDCPASRWETYDEFLARLCGGFARAHATALQRAIAFILTKQSA